MIYYISFGGWISWKCRWYTLSAEDEHCVKRVHIRSFSGPYPAFGLNMDQKNPYTDTFYAVETTE